MGSALQNKDAQDFAVKSVTVFNFSHITAAPPAIPDSSYPMNLHGTWEFQYSESQIPVTHVGGGTGVPSRTPT
jgi:hypothetical protein